MSNSREHSEDWSNDFEDNFDKAYEDEKKRFDDIVKTKLVISLIGDVNVGKSATINSLTGKKLSEVIAIAGSTKYVSLHKFYENTVYIADTPGLNDINESNSKLAMDFVEKDADIILLFFNAAVGASKPIIDMYKELKKLNKPIVLILNKIDIWFNDKGILEDYDDYNNVVQQILEETGEHVIPVSAKRNFNILELNNRIVEILKKNGKDLLFLKVSNYKESEVKNWIHGATISAFGIGIIPIPGADIIPLTTLQVGLAMKTAYIYNCKASKNDIMSLIAATITGSLGKQLFRFSVQALKALGWLGTPIVEGAISALAGVIAASVTYAFGWACNEYYKSGMTFDFGDVFTKARKEYFERNKDKGTKGELI